MIDLGESLGDQPTAAKGKDRKYYSSLTVPASAHPALSSAKVGDSVYFKAHAEVTGIRQSMVDGKERHEVSVELRRGSFENGGAGEKATKYCPGCARRALGSAHYCPGCGSKLEKMSGNPGKEY